MKAGWTNPLMMLLNLNFLPTLVFLAGQLGCEITDPSSQPQPEHMDEGFIATAYPEVQENLKLTVDEQMILEEPVSSTGTLSISTPNPRHFAMAINSFEIKPQGNRVIPPMPSRFSVPCLDPFAMFRGLLPPLKPQPQTITTTTIPLPPQPQQGLSDPIIIKRMGELEELIVNLVKENQALEERLDKQGSRINKLETMDLPKMIREQTVEFIDLLGVDKN
ncbi:hypothetical protein Tco_0831379 [Tanacetum coccineum]